jgi:transcriptional regulator with XRE-family HTH domain
MSRDVNPEVGRRIAERRKALGLTIPELAQRMQRDPRRVAEFEREGVGTLRMVEQIAQALDVWPGLLAFGTPPDGAANDSAEGAFHSRPDGDDRSDGNVRAEDTAPESRTREPAP